jgi:BlaI family penicillinase repressor
MSLLSQFRLLRHSGSGASVHVPLLSGLVRVIGKTPKRAGRTDGRLTEDAREKDQEFVIGGDTVGGSTLDALIFGHCQENQLIYAVRTRRGFTPRLRQYLMNKFRPLEMPACPFANPREAKSGRLGAGLTAAKMKRHNKRLTSFTYVSKVDAMEQKFSATELQVMEEFWKSGRLSVREIQESFPEKDRPPYTSIQTIVYRLEEKGAVRRVRKIGNAHIFEAVMSRQEARGRILDDLLGLFGGKAQSIMAHLVESGKLTREDLRETDKLIVELERKDHKEKKR